MKGHIMNNYETTFVPDEYIKPIKNVSTQTPPSDFIDLVNKPAFKTFTPEGYIRCPDRRSIYTFSPFIKWMKMVLKVKAVNTPKSGGAGFEDIMDNLLDQAHELLTSNAKRS